MTDLIFYYSLTHYENRLKVSGSSQSIREPITNTHTKELLNVVQYTSIFCECVCMCMHVNYMTTSHDHCHV